MVIPHRSCAVNQGAKLWVKGITDACRGPELARRHLSHCLMLTQGFLGTAFMIEGVIFAFHLKGSGLDKALHVILVLLVFAAALLCYAEIR